MIKLYFMMIRKVIIKNYGNSTDVYKMKMDNIHKMNIQFIQ